MPAIGTIHEEQQHMCAKYFYALPFSLLTLSKMLLETKNMTPHFIKKKYFRTQTLHRDWLFPN